VNDIYYLHPTDPSSQWLTLTHNGSVPQRNAHTATAVGGQIYVFGGWNNSGSTAVYFNDLWSFDTTQMYKGGFGKIPYWVQVSPNTPAPPARNSHSAVNYQGSLWIFGGFSHDTSQGTWVNCNPGDKCVWYNDLWQYSRATNNWVQMAPRSSSPSGRYGASMGVIGNLLLVFGGSGQTQVFNDLWAYDFSQNEWRQLTISGTKPSPRYGAETGVIGSSFYILGGGGTGNNLWRFTPNVEQSVTNAEETNLGPLTGAAWFAVVCLLAIAILAGIIWKKVAFASSTSSIQSGLDD